MSENKNNISENYFSETVILNKNNCLAENNKRVSTGCKDKNVTKRIMPRQNGKKEANSQSLIRRFQNTILMLIY
jgi:hypothetical protein